MTEGVNYLKQAALPTGRRPDFTFLLPPDGDRLHMDVKFPLESYDSYLQAVGDTERQRAVSEFRKSLRGHVSDLATRDGYTDPSSGVGCVMMFIPVEAVFAFLHQQCPEVVDEASAKKVLVCSPATLLGVLTVIRRCADMFAMERSAGDILDALAGFEQEWQRCTKIIDMVDSQLDTLRKSVDALSTGGTRRRALDRALDRVDSLRARTVPAGLPRHPHSNAGRSRPALPSRQDARSEAGPNRAPAIAQTAERSARQARPPAGPSRGIIPASAELQKRSLPADRPLARATRHDGLPASATILRRGDDRLAADGSGEPGPRRPAHAPGGVPLRE